VELRVKPCVHAAPIHFAFIGGKQLKLEAAKVDSTRRPEMKAHAQHNGKKELHLSSVKYSNSAAALTERVLARYSAVVGASRIILQGLGRIDIGVSQKWYMIINGESAVAKQGKF
jgi:hypothetical protein